MTKKKAAWYVMLKRCWHSAELRWVEAGELADWSHLSAAERKQHEMWGTARPATDDEIAIADGSDGDSADNEQE